MTEVNNEMIQAVLQIIRSANLPAPAESVPPPIAAQQQPPSLFDLLQQGQQYQVTVLNPDVDGKALLRIMGEKVLVDTQLPLKQGQHLTVEVTGKTDGIQLAVKLSPTQSDIQAQFLKLILPRQEPISSLLKALNDFILLPAENKAATAASSLPILQLLSQQLLAQIPQASDLKDPAIFQKLLTESGIFLESRLAHGQVPQNDLKSSLLRIVEQLKPQLSQSTAETTTGARTVQATSTAAVHSPPALATSNRPAISEIAKQAALNQAKTTTMRSQNVESAATVLQKNTVSGAPVNSDARIQLSGNTSEISQLKGVTEKSGLTATQAAQKAMMLTKSEPVRLLQSFTTNLLSNNAIQGALNLLPKTELHLLIKQLLFKNRSGPGQNMAVNANNQRLAQLSELLKSVESGIARIQTQQLASIPQDEATRQVWQLEIPLRDQKELQALMLRIEQDDSQASKEASGSTWTVCLNFNIGKSGHIHSKVRLTQDVISTHFWAEQDNTVQKISASLPRLAKALEKLGLTVNHMTSSLGKPPDPVEIQTIENRLLDESA